MIRAKNTSVHKQTTVSKQQRRDTILRESLFSCVLLFVRLKKDFLL